MFLYSFPNFSEMEKSSHSWDFMSRIQLCSPKDDCVCYIMSRSSFLLFIRLIIDSFNFVQNSELWKSWQDIKTNLKILNNKLTFFESFLFLFETFILECEEYSKYAIQKVTPILLSQLSEEEHLVCHQATGLIVGGNKAAVKEFPHMVINI